MKKRLLALFLCVVMLSGMLPLSASAEVSSLQGNGTEADPYQLSNAEELCFASEKMNASDEGYVGKYYILTADIDMSSVSQFPMISKFTGSLNGNGHTISDLRVYHPEGSSYYRSAFIDQNSGKIFDLTFDRANIIAEYDRTGSGVAGASVVAGENCQDGVISRVTVKNSTVYAPKMPKGAAITSMNSRAGNTTGVNIATVTECAVINTTVTAGPRAEGNAYGLMMGAIAGYSASSILENCYVSGITLQAASETASPFHAGMVCGYGAGGSIDGNVVAGGSIVRLAPEGEQKFNTLKLGGICPSQNTFYGALKPTKGNLIDTANAPAGTTVLTGTVKTADQLKQQTTYEALGWNFYEVWKLEDSVPALRLPSERIANQLEGLGTEEDPFLISTAEELLYMAERSNEGDARFKGKYFALTNDIDLSSVEEFPMINSNSGVFDGRGHTISNLRIYHPADSSYYRSAFIDQNSGKICDVTFDNAQIVAEYDRTTSGVAGAAVVAGENCQDGIISCVTVKNSSVYAPKIPKGAAITSMNSRAGNTTGINIATVTDCVVKDTTVTAGPRAEGNAYGLMMGAIAGYSGSSIIKNCYVSGITLQAASETASPFHAGMICGYGAGGSIDGNAVAGGSIVRLAPEGEQKFNSLKLGGICPTQNTYYGALEPIKGNLIDTANATEGSTTLTGTVKTADELKLQSTYADLGWNFASTWKMQDSAPALKHPDERIFIALEGLGTANYPYLISSVDDLIKAVEYLNGQGKDLAEHFALSCDIDMTGVVFTPIDSFAGTFDGRGNHIINLEITDTITGNAGDYRLAFIRINTGTVKNIVFDSPTVTTLAFSSGGYAGAAVIVGDNAHGSLISQCVVNNGTVYAPNLPKAAGICVLNARTNMINATVSSCVFDGEIVCGPRTGSYGPMAGGIAAYSATSTIEYCLANADVTIAANETTLSTVASAAIICGYCNGVTYRGNVAYGGSVTIEGSPATQNTGYLYGCDAFNNQNVLTNVYCEELTINGEKVTESHKKYGIPKTADELIHKDVYNAIGWSFDSSWVMNNGTVYPERYPVPGRVEYTDEKINMLNATILSDNGCDIGFSWHYLAGKEMSIKLSTDKNFTENVITVDATSSDNVYRAKVSGLNEGTTYYYRAEGDGQLSEAGKLTTAVTDAPFSFISIADTEAADFAEAGKTASGIGWAQEMVEDASFILHSGDVADSSRGDEGYKDLLYQMSDELLAMPFVLTQGEEDKSGADKHFYIENNYYSFDYGNAHFIILDTNDSAEKCLSDEQIAWLKADCEAADKDWVILSMHKGPYTTGQHASDEEIKALRELFIGELDDLGIDLVIQGHDHIMGHSYDLKDGEKTDTAIFTETLNGKRFEYSVDPSGVVYMMSGGMGQAGQQLDMDDLDSYILNFARSDGRGDAKTFAGIRVEKDRITVENYEIVTGQEPTMIEGFGIDREISRVEELISAGDKNLAWQGFHDLTTEQKAEVSNIELLKDENIGGSWLEEEATQRRSILIHNDTDNSFSYVPVVVKIENAPNENMAFYTTDGEALPYEVESFNSEGTSYVWVKVPHIPAKDCATLWVYFGTNDGFNAPHKVWADSYALVEHFEGVEYDSTGKQKGNVTGNISEASYDGDMGVAFDGASNISYDGVGDDFGHISISAVISSNAEDIGSASGIVSKYVAGDPTGKNAYLIGLDAEGKLNTHYSCMWWRDNRVRKKDYITELIADGQPHLVTLAYNGFTVETYIDGESVSWETVFIESTTLLDPNIPTVIGSYSPYLDNSIAGGFKGNVYDVQINGQRTNDQWESFRYSCYFGDGVTVGAPEEKGQTTLTLDRADREVAEAGSQRIVGILSADTVLTLEAEGKVTDLGTVKAGRIEVDVTLSGSAERIVTLSGEGVEESVTLTVADKSSPVATASKEDDKLVVSTETAQGDSVTVDYGIYEAITLNAENTSVAEGETEGKTPAGIDPTQGDYQPISAELTSSSKANPYQIYKIDLTDEEAEKESYRIFWQGTSDRQIHAYGYDHTKAEWIKLASTEGEGELKLDISVQGSQYLSDNTLYIMIFRGMGQEIEELSSYTPEEGQYDFTMFWNSDTQYMSQFTEELVYHQHSWIADVYEENKGVITFNTGDLANRSNLNYQYNWDVVEKSYRIFEEQGIPYTFCWGNHDIDYDKEPNEGRFYQSYFPADRMTANAGDWEVSYAPDDVTGVTTRAMAYKQTIEGAKLMILSLAYDSRLTSSDLDWAEQMVASHPDYTVIVITHTYSSGTAINETDIRSQIVDKYSNVKLVLNGHLDGASAFKMENGGFAVLQDYQGEFGDIKHGGNEFMRLIKFDVENDLIYFNTYSPLTGETLSPYGADLDPEAEGLYQKNGDEFVLNIELNSDADRSFTTNFFKLSGEGQAQSHNMQITEGDRAELLPEGLKGKSEYIWYATVTDTSSNSTVTNYQSFITSDYALEEAKEELKAKLDSLPEYNEADYTPDSWDAFVSAKLAAENLLNTAEGADVILEAIINLDNAIAGLTEKGLSFIDVKENHWYYNSVSFVVKKGYMNGMSETKFSPNGNITREQFVLILANMAGVNTDEYKYTDSGFTDVKTGQWYSGAVAWAVQEGYVSGVSATSFGRGQSIQRGALARLLYVYAESNGVDVSARADITGFGDSASLDLAGNLWMKEPIQWAVSQGIISGMEIDGVLSVNPKGTATRAQAAVMLTVFDELLP